MKEIEEQHGTYGFGCRFSRLMMNSYLLLFGILILIVLLFHGRARFPMNGVRLLLGFRDGSVIFFLVVVKDVVLQLFLGYVTIVKTDVRRKK